MLCFMCRDPSAEVWWYFDADLEVFSVPLANNMEANRPLSLLRASSILDNQRQSIWRTYFMGLHAEKDPGFNFRWN